MNPIVIKTIPHEQQRYKTVGDYFTRFDSAGEFFTKAGTEKCGSVATRQFRISEMGNPDYEFLVALHELIESHLVQKRGIPDAAIDEFDIEFEKRRAAAPPDFADYAEPGSDPAAPYYREHQFATAIEKSVAEELGVDWDEYDRAVKAL